MSGTRADSIRVMCPLFHAGEGGSTPTSALQLRFGTIKLDEAKALNRLWHSRLPQAGRPQCRVAYAASFDGVFYAVAIWTSPIARNLPQTAWLELNRFAIAPDAPKNTASRMLGWMSRSILTQFSGVVRLISYQDMEAHTGGIYRACGWLPFVVSNGGDGWAKTRPRSRSAQTAAPKCRWDKIIRPEAKP